MKGSLYLSGSYSSNQGNGVSISSGNSSIATGSVSTAIGTFTGSLNSISIWGDSSSVIFLITA